MENSGNTGSANLGQDDQRYDRNKRSALRGWAVVIAVLALFVGLYTLNPLHSADDSATGRLTGFRLFRSPSPSMEPTIRLGSLLITSAWPYAFGGEPKVGDMIVFRYPRDPSVLYIKRVIGTPNSTLAVLNGITTLNGAPLAEPYLRGGVPNDPNFPQLGPWNIPAASYFVMGDNRMNSEDSRVYGWIPRAAIVGKVIAVSGER